MFRVKDYSHLMVRGPHRYSWFGDSRQAVDGRRRRAVPSSRIRRAGAYQLGKPCQPIRPPIGPAVSAGEPADGV